ncbi:MAG: hypothetical protein J1F43_04370 [Muribaculaceae bacterium]|nr:hypothetical protein [Muribaculaceae bacterium]
MKKSGKHIINHPSFSSHLLLHRENLWLVTIFLLYGLSLSTMPVEAKKIKNSFTIEKKKPGKSSQKDKPTEDFEGMEINLKDSIQNSDSRIQELLPSLRKCSFAGYDKEPNSNLESFILVNTTDQPILGYDVRIDYLDMQGRMLHSRNIRQKCLVPPGETRRFDIKSWDPQHVYYYYLGNEPKRVATPFQVKFTPLSLWIPED